MEAQDLPRRCRRRCSERTSDNAPVSVEIFDDAVRPLAGVIQASQRAIDHAPLGTIEWQLVLALDQIRDRLLKIDHLMSSKPVLFHSIR
jgi:hypothetical protein